MKQQSIVLLMVASFAALWPARAAANMRAPGYKTHAPSSALRTRAPASGLVVQGERLAIACDKTCDVVATYTVDAKAARTVELEFVLPTSAPIEVRHGQAAVAPIVAEAKPLAPHEYQLDRSSMKARYGGGDAPLFRARFSLALTAGQNAIEVRYVQPLGGQERGHGYFSDGTWVHRFHYELWPLAEWALADDFSMQVAVSWTLPEVSTWTKWFGEVPAVRCLGGGRGVTAETPLAPTATKKIASGRQLDFVWGRQFPDRLICERSGMPTAPLRK